MTDLPPLEPLPPVDRNAAPITRADQLASDLARELSGENGAAILKQARAILVANGGRQGIYTSEFLMSITLILAGLVMIGLGLWKGSTDLQGQGSSLISVVGAGYAVSRGIAKAGAAKAEAGK